MRFYDVSEVPEKSVFTRLFCVFATCVLANFQANKGADEKSAPLSYHITLKMSRVFEKIRVNLRLS